MHLGLRARVVVTLAAVSALTLAVAAVTLLSPLDRLLRDNELDAFATSLRNERGALTTLPASRVTVGDRRLLRGARALARHNNAVVNVLDPDGRILVSTDPDDPLAPGTSADPQSVLAGKTHKTVTGEGPDTRAEVVFALRVHGRPVIVAAQRQLDYLSGVTRLVRRAFGVAAAAGLAGALLFGLLLAGRTVRRIPPPARHRATGVEHRPRARARARARPHA